MISDTGQLGVSAATNRLATAFVGAVSGVMVVFLPMNNTLTALLGAGAIGAAGAILADALITPRRLERRAAVAVPRLLMALLVGGVLGNWLRLDPEWAFEQAFTQPPAASVQHVTASGSYLGRQSDSVIYVEFAANAKTIERLTAQLDCYRNAEAEMRLTSPTEWWGTWRTLFPDGRSLGGAALRRPSEPQSPRVYEWRVEQGKRTVSVVMVWDEKSGVAIARLCRG